MTRSGSLAPDYDCSIVGAGPAGAMLALLLARAGLRVVLLEAGADFEREFRGDTLHPSALEILDEIGLATRLLELPHSRIQRGVGETPEGEVLFYDFSRLPSPFRYIALMPQARFLEFLTHEASRYPGFTLRMGSAVHGLVKDRWGVVRGVRYRSGGREYEATSSLTVGCDGRGSVIRRLAGLDIDRGPSAIDVLWFRLPKAGPSPAGFRSLIGPGHLLVLVDRGDHWQAGCVVRKGGIRELRREGIARFRESLAEMAPEFAGHLGNLSDWSRISVLSVQSMRLPRWWSPGLLLIGDAAHVMSPIGGAGISLAIQDAVAAANTVARPLRHGRLEDAHLAGIQRQRSLAVSLVQTFQRLVEVVLISGALDRRGTSLLPWLLKIPPLGWLPTRLVGLGPWRVHVSPELSGETPDRGNR
jgi:2-polyprenyl-6-methoxyphenol hydroxylase-like FAD-dependent oxidoreductase